MRQLSMFRSGMTLALALLLLFVIPVPPPAEAMSCYDLAGKMFTSSHPVYWAKRYYKRCG